MFQHTISKIAIWLMAVVMIVFGIYHFQKPQNLLSYVPNYLPGGIAWVYIVGAAFILAGLAFIFDRFVAVAGYLLALLLVSFVLLIHFPQFRNAGDADMRQIALINLLKDLAIAGFALFIAANARKQHIRSV